MRILVLSTWFPYPPTNGSELRAYYLLRALAEHHQVTALALNKGARADQCPLPPLSGVELIAVPADPFRYVGLPACVRYASPIPLSMWPIGELRRALHGPAVRGDHWDAIVVLQGPVLRYLTTVPAAARIADIDTSLSFQLRERHAAASGVAVRARTLLSWRKAEVAERMWLRHATAATLSAAAEQPYLSSLTGCRIEHLPNGVDCEHNRPGLASSRPGSLVYNGAMTYSANYDAMRYFLEDIYPLVRARVPEANLTITGGTDGVDLDSLNMDETVRLSGFVDDVRPLVAGSAVCIVPLREGGGTRLKILEAMALGVPVVSTSKGAEGLEVTDGDHLLIADDPDAFAEATARLLEDGLLRARLAHAGRALVERLYDWTSIGARFAELVEQAVALERAGSC